MITQEEKSPQKIQKNSENFKEKFEEEEEEDDKDQFQYDDSESNSQEDDYNQSDSFINDEDEDFNQSSNQEEKTGTKKKTTFVKDEEDMDYIVQNHRKLRKNLHKKNEQIQKVVQNDKENQQEEDWNEKENQNEEFQEEEIQLEEIFDPQDLIDNYQTKQDQQIIEKDIPERLQLRYQKVPLNEDLVKETQWMTEQLIQNYDLARELTQELRTKILKILEFLKLNHYEIMYIWFHQKSAFMTMPSQKRSNYELTQSNLWFIYEKDLEWEEINRKRNTCQKILSQIQQHLDVSQENLQMYTQFANQSDLQFLEDYLMYHSRKIKNQFEIDEMLGIQNQFKKIEKRFFPKEIYELNLEPVIYQISITPSQLALNLEQKSQMIKPQEISISIDNFFHSYTRPDVEFLESPIKTIESFCSFLAGEYFYHVQVKKHLRLIYNNFVTISTNPTKKGKQISIYDYFYPVKRIRNKKPQNLNLELWWLIREAEDKGLIETTFDIESAEKQQQIFNELGKFIYSKKPNDPWNDIREKIIEYLFRDFMIPFCKKALMNDFNIFAEKHILKKCGEKFLNLINMKPYKNQYVKVMSCTLDEEENAVIGIINEIGDLIDYITLFNILKKPKEGDFSQQILYEKDLEILQKFITFHKPNTILISPKNIRMQQLKIEIQNIQEKIFNSESKIEKAFVMWSNNKISSLFSKSNLSNVLLNELSPYLKEIVSAARYIQNPLAEVLNLWSDDENKNAVILINFHPSQNYLNKKKMKNYFENIILEIVNTKGVDINSCMKYNHLKSPLQFVCGLGPRKTKFLLDYLNTNFEVIQKRKQLKNILCMKENVYKNAIAFLRINEMLDSQNFQMQQEKTNYWLDFTRIHPDYYPIAIKLSRAANDSKVKDNQIVLSIMKNPKLLDDLDEKVYASQLSQNNLNMYEVVAFILQELKNPYADNRIKFDTKFDEKEIFYALTQESPYNLKEESIMTLKILSIEEKGFRVVTNNGLTSFIGMNDILEKEYNEEEIKNKYTVGDFIKAKVKNINYQNVKIRFSLKNDDFLNHKEYLKKNKIFEEFDLILDDTFLIIREDDYPLIQIEGKRKLGRFVPRDIKHPHFKSLGLKVAQDYLKDRQNGSFLFRPSSKGTDYLNLTWKFFDEILVHLNIKEGFKSAKETISKELTLNRQQYGTLDEIIENFIKPCNLHVSEIIKNKKFLTKPIEQVKQMLTEIKTQNRQKIPYFFSFTEQQPQFLILSYIPEKMTVKHELIKVKPEGLNFHGLSFPNLDTLTNYFKEKFKTKEYQRYLDNMPQIELGKQKVLVTLKEEGIKEEKSRRYRDDYRSDRFDKERSHKEREYEGDRRPRRDYRNERKYERRENYDERRENYNDRRENYEERKYKREDFRERREYKNRDEENDRRKDFKDDRKRRIKKEYNQDYRRRDYENNPRDRRRNYENQQEEKFESQGVSNYYTPLDTPAGPQTPRRQENNQEEIKFEHA